jgi:hypothetical protein
MAFQQRSNAAMPSQSATTTPLVVLNAALVLAGGESNKNNANLATPLIPAATPVTHVVGERHDHHLHKHSWKTWARRLNTHEDTRSMHKISSASFVLPSLAILAIGLAKRGGMPLKVLAPLTYLHVTASLLQMVRASQMALKYRKHVTERNGMIGCAISSAYSSIMALWVCPFAPAIFDIAWVSKSINLLMGSALMLLSADAMVRTNTLTSLRADKHQHKACHEGGHYKDNNHHCHPPNQFLDKLSYVLPIVLNNGILGLVPVYFLGIRYDRAWYLDLMKRGIVNCGQAFYVNIFTSFAVAVIAFLATLRDRQLITKGLEGFSMGALGLILAAMTVPAFIPLFVGGP